MTSLPLAVALCAFLPVIVAQNTALKHTKTVYVGPLHFATHSDWDAVVRSKMIGSLTQYCGLACTVSETGDLADVVLTGDMLVQTDAYHDHIQGAMRLVDRHGTVVLMATIYSNPFDGDATSNFADAVAKKVSAYLMRK